MIGRFIICKKCKAQNQLSSLNCLNCSQILRDRVVNLDFLKIVSLLIENPVKGFNYIILSENKNFITLFLFFFIFKTSLLNYSISPYLGLYIRYFPLTLFYTVIITILLIVFIIILTKFLLRLILVKLRIKDYFALIIYPLFPFFFSLVLLSLLELAVFGNYLFEISPTPFEIKPALAYIFVIFEILLLLWSLVLYVIAFQRIIQSKLLSAVIGVIGFFIIVVLPHLVLFNIVR